MTLFWNHVSQTAVPRGEEGVEVTCYTLALVTDNND